MVEVRRMEKIWMNGTLISSAEAKISVGSHTIHYGDGLFEGIRCYKGIDGRVAIFRLGSHIHRMFFGAAVIGIKIPYNFLEIEKAVIDTAKANNLDDGDYIRPLIIVGEGDMGPFPENNPVYLIIETWKWGNYFGEGALHKGIKVLISKKWRRDNRVLPFRAKVIGHYVNARLIKSEAKEAGYDEGLVKDLGGHIVEASAANIFIAKDGGLITPSEDAPILRGITRNSIIQIARNLGISVEDTFISENRLFTADEAFLCGTAAEFTPIRSVEERLIGGVCPGPLTKKLRDLFFQAARGELPEYKHWLTYI